MQDPDFAEIVGLICKEDPRFDRKAYDFIRLGLDHAVKELKKKDTGRAARSRHVSGPELLEGIRIYAFDQFGPLAKTLTDQEQDLRKRALYRAGVLAAGLDDVDSARKYLSTLAELDFGYRDVAQRLDKLTPAKDNRAGS